MPVLVNYTALLKTRPIVCSSVMIDRAKMNIRMPPIGASSGIHEDLGAWLGLLKTTNAYGLNMDLLRLRKSRGSRSSDKVRAAFNVCRVYREHEGLNLTSAVWYFSHYAVNSLLSRIRAN